MNRLDFKNTLKDKLNMDDNKVESILEILDDNFFIGKNSKEKIVTEFVEKVGVDRIQAEKIYEDIMSTIAVNLKNKIKHPFKK